VTKTVGKVPVVSHPHVADHFVDEVIAFDHRNGTVRLTLATLKMAEPAAPSPMQYVAVGRLIMPEVGAQRLAIALFDYLKKQGLDPTTVVGAGEGPIN
jgi:hypothetical protein